MKELGELWSPQVVLGATLIVPVGSCEQHGPHLPLDTDTRIAFAVARQIASEISGCVVAPAIAIGASGEHAGFPGTLSIGTETLALVLIEIVRSAGPEFERIMFLNGHGGNQPAIDRAAKTLTHDGHQHVLWHTLSGYPDAHAGHGETSVMLHFAPEFVGVDRPVGASGSWRELTPELRRGGVISVSPNGVLGDATDANAANGKRIFDQLVANAQAALL